MDAEKTKVPVSIPISSRVLEKAHALCDVVKEVGGSSYEWFSFLLASKNDPTYQVRDLMLVDGVEVTSGSVHVSGEDHAKAAEEVRKRNAQEGTEYYIIGWLHSHADSEPFHSPTDDGNFRQLLNSIAFNTEFSEGVTLPLIESNLLIMQDKERVIVTGEELEDGTLQYTVPNTEAFQHWLRKQGVRQRLAKKIQPAVFLQDLLRLTSLQVEEPKITGFGYSIVINEKRAPPYAEIGILEELIITKPKEKNFRKIIKASLQIIGEENTVDNIVVDRAALKTLVEERLRFPQKFEPKYYSAHFANGMYDEDGDGDEVRAWPKLAGPFRRWQAPTEGHAPHSSLYSSHASPPPYFDGIRPSWEEERQSKELIEAFTESVKIYLQMAKTSDLVRYEKYIRGLQQQIRNLHTRHYQRSGLTEAIQKLGLPIPGPAEENESGVYYGDYYSLRTALETSFGRKSPFIDEEKAFMRAFVIEDKNTVIVEHVPRLLAKIHAYEQEEQARAEQEEAIALQHGELVQRFLDKYTASLRDVTNPYTDYLSDVLTELPRATNLRGCFQQVGKLYRTLDHLPPPPFTRENVLNDFLRLAVAAPAEDVLFFEAFVVDPVQALEKYVPLFVVKPETGQKKYRRRL